MEITKKRNSSIEKELRKRGQVFQYNGFNITREDFFDPETPVVKGDYVTLLKSLGVCKVPSHKDLRCQKRESMIIIVESLKKTCRQLIFVPEHRTRVDYIEGVKIVKNYYTNDISAGRHVVGKIEVKKRYYEDGNFCYVIDIIEKNPKPSPVYRTLKIGSPKQFNNSIRIAEGSYISLD